MEIKYLKCKYFVTKKETTLNFFRGHIKGKNKRWPSTKISFVIIFYALYFFKNSSTKTLIPIFNRFYNKKKMLIKEHKDKNNPHKGTWWIRDNQSTIPY